MIQTKGHFVSTFPDSSGNKFTFPEPLAKQNPEKEAEYAKDNNKILPGLKWMR